MNYLRDETACMVWLEFREMVHSFKIYVIVPEKALFVSYVPITFAIKTFSVLFLTRGYRAKATIFNPRFDYLLVVESPTSQLSDLSKENEE